MNDKELSELESKLIKARMIKEEIRKIENNIILLNYFKNESGNTKLVAYSGKVNDITPLGEINLNEMHCAVNVLDLMIETGNKIIDNLENAFEEM